MLLAVAQMLRCTWRSRFSAVWLVEVGRIVLPEDNTLNFHTTGEPRPCPRLLGPNSPRACMPASASWCSQRPAADRRRSANCWKYPAVRGRCSKRWCPTRCRRWRTGSAARSTRPAANRLSGRWPWPPGGERDGWHPKPSRGCWWASVQPPAWRAIGPSGASIAYTWPCRPRRRPLRIRLHSTRELAIARKKSGSPPSWC